MAKPRVFITHGIPKLAIELLRDVATVEMWQQDQPITRSQLLDRVSHAVAVITTVDDAVDEAFLRAAGPDLKLVANYAVGYDNVDLAVCARHSVVVTNTPGVLTEAVAEHAIGLMFAVARRIVEADQFVRAGKYQGWLPLGFLGPQLWGKTIGIVGLGRIGGWVAQMAVEGLRMEALYTSPHPDEELEMRLGATRHELSTVLKRADVVTLHVPLADDTHHLIGAKELRLMPPHAILINTARGPVVDQAALIEALKTGEIAGAGLDVFEHEPDIPAALRRLPNVVLTPHIASATIEARNAMAEIAAKNVVAVLGGKSPITPVTH